MLTGIQAVCDLRGGPASGSDAAKLGLHAGDGAFAGTAVDSTGTGAAHAFHTSERVTLMTGHAEGLADDHDCPAKSGDLPLAARIGQLLDRYGASLPARLAGEWLLVDWQPGRLRIVQSLARHDWLFVAQAQGRVAIASDLAKLTTLDWLTRDLDSQGFAAAMGRGALRERAPRRSIVPGVERLEPGAFWELTIDRTRRETCDWPAPEPWSGTFPQAVEAASARLDMIGRERMARSGGKAIMLSGGLDSSLLAQALCAAAPDRAKLFCVTSVATDGSGIGDERAYAGAVAQHLSLQQSWVVPRPGVCVYRPDPEAYQIAGGPSLSVRHYLMRALAEAARTEGAATLFDGGFGELTLTSYMPLATWAWRLRQTVKAAIRPATGATVSPVHVRLAPHRLTALRSELGEVTVNQIPQNGWRRRGQRWGYFPGVDKAMSLPTVRDFGMRAEYPFRDPRLLSLFAGFPADYLVQGGLDRAPARAMLAGRLPEHIRLRRTTGPFSPDYMTRIRADAPAALARLPLFRRAGCDDWLDLTWLESALASLPQTAEPSIAHAFEVQLTAMAAEFLVWWRRAE